MKPYRLCLLLMTPWPLINVSTSSVCNLWPHPRCPSCSISSWAILPQTYVTHLHKHTLDVHYIINAPSFMHHWDSWYIDSRPPSCSEMPYQPSTQGHYHIRRSHISLRVNLSFQSWNWNFTIHLTSDQVSKFAASIGFLFLLDRPNFSLCFDRDMYRTSLDSN